MRVPGTFDYFIFNDDETVRVRLIGDSGWYSWHLEVREIRRNRVKWCAVRSCDGYDDYDRFMRHAQMAMKQAEASGTKYDLESDSLAGIDNRRCAVKAIEIMLYFGIDPEEWLNAETIGDFERIRERISD